MDILYLLIPLSLALVFLIGAVFWWSLSSGQFDDLEGPGFRILMDDDRPARPEASDAQNPITAPLVSPDQEQQSQSHSGINTLR